MTQRAKHVGKSASAKQNYNKVIKTLGYDPTIEEKYEYSETDNFEKDYSIQSSSHRRSMPLIEQIKDHFKTNWFVWLFVLFGLVITFFVFNFNRDMGTVEGVLYETKSKVDKQEEKIEKIDQKVQDQNLKVQENSLKIENLKEKVDKK